MDNKYKSSKQNIDEGLKEIRGVGLSHKPSEHTTHLLPSIRTPNTTNQQSMDYMKNGSSINQNSVSGMMNNQNNKVVTGSSFPNSLTQQKIGNEITQLSKTFGVGNNNNINQINNEYKTIDQRDHPQNGILPNIVKGSSPKLDNVLMKDHSTGHGGQQTNTYSYKGASSIINSQNNQYQHQTLQPGSQTSQYHQDLSSSHNGKVILNNKSSAGVTGKPQRQGSRNSQKSNTITNIQLKNELNDSGKKPMQADLSNIQTIQPLDNDMGMQHRSLIHGKQATQFESYLSKVINSVQNRKKAPRFRSQHQEVVSQTQRSYDKQHFDQLDPSLNLGPIPNNYQMQKYQPPQNQQAISQNAHDYHLNIQSEVVSQNNNAAVQQQANITGQFGSQDYQTVPYNNQQQQNQVQLYSSQTKNRKAMSTSRSGTAQTKNSGQNSYQVSMMSNGQQEGSQQNQPRPTEQVAFLLRQVQKKDKIFIPLDIKQEPQLGGAINIKEMKNPPENHAGIVVFSKNGFVAVGKEKNAQSNFISNQEFVENGVTNKILKDVPFFKKFQSMRLFKQWKYIMRKNVYARTRKRLAENLIFSKPIFSEKYPELIGNINSMRGLPLVEIKQNVVYGKKQQATLEERCQKSVESTKQIIEDLMTKIKGNLHDIKQAITEDDEQFVQAIKEVKVKEMLKKKQNHDNVVMFSKEREKQEKRQEQYRLQELRHQQFDKLVEMTLRYWAANLLELLYENKRDFNTVFSNPKSATQFEVSICFNDNGILDSDPSMDQHRDSFETVFSNMEKVVFKNQTLLTFTHDMNDFYYNGNRHFTRALFEFMSEVLKNHKQFQDDSKNIFQILQSDVSKCQSQIQHYQHLQEIHDFCHKWTSQPRGKQSSLEMGFYKETWAKMDKFTSMIQEVPTSNTRIGMTILVETLSLKKQLQEMPRQVIESIRHNVTQTMENETKSLKEELSKTSEILDQLPTSLNVYVEQVNTLKYIKEKNQDFAAKFQTIQKLHLQCKQDNIKVGLNLQMSIEEVQSLYENLPNLQKSAQEGLLQNKETMERIMKSSSLVLSKKIKAFQQKYIEAYLKDKTRLDDCADTLEELFKRSKAIHEIRSKVILYKEFLKLLYEDDEDIEDKLEKNKLSCSEDYEFLQDLHTKTIKLWKIMLYWKKRRQLCYQTPFLELDTDMIIKTIAKVNRYLEEKLPKNEFMMAKCQVLTKVINQQVKDTSVIIEFVKNLRKDSLKQRHWIQIFTLIKAPHLRNSTTFTIVDLKEYHVQNYNDEISQIIEHANTELKYETIYRSIQAEWEKLDLKIIPFRESDDSYLMVNTDTLSNAIEENLTTLESLSQSQYAAHVKSEIVNWIKTLETMASNLEIWVEAQQYWVNLDPIFNTDLFQDFFGEKKQDFMECRQQFKRIMWSSYKNPKAIYNLMIQSRISTFQDLIVFYSDLQKKVHEYLEQKRIAFPRFFFLNDSQFLEFLTLVKTNQDYSKYINVLFRGAQKLYVTQLPQYVDTNQETSRMMSPSLGATDYGRNTKENDIEQYLQNANEGYRNEIARVQKSVSDYKYGDEKLPASLYSHDKEGIEENENEKSMFDYIENTLEDIINKNFEPLVEANQSTLQQQVKNSHTMEDSIQSSGQHNNINTQSDSDSSDNDTGADYLDDPFNKSGENPVLYDEDERAEMRKRKKEIKKRRKLEMQHRKSQGQLQVMGFIGNDKELFLFESPVLIQGQVEEWLKGVEYAMQETIQSMIQYSISGFTNYPMDEWCTDYPQQIAITTLQLVLTYEINDILEHNNQDYVDPDEVEKDQRSTEMSKLQHSKISSEQAKANEEADGVSQEGVNMMSMEERNKRKQAMANKTKAEERERAIRARRELQEPQKDPEREKRKFIDNMMGKDFPIDEMMNEALTELATFQENQRKKNMAKKRESLHMKKPTFEDQFTELLKRKNLTALFYRIQYWINSLVKICHRKSQMEYKDLPVQFQLMPVQKKVLKSLIIFLTHQRDTVHSMIQHKVNNVDDFAWKSKLRVLWNDETESAQIHVGGWATHIGNEYLGTQQRLILSPLTDRYFVYMSSALREKSGTIFNCIPAHQNCSDIVEEFASQCSIPFVTYDGHQDINVPQLMQIINGASMASVWVFMEHLDQLDMVVLQLLVKEVQMVQQQFIIREAKLMEGIQERSASVLDGGLVSQTDLRSQGGRSSSIHGGKEDQIYAGKNLHISQQHDGDKINSSGNDIINSMKNREKSSMSQTHGSQYKGDSNSDLMRNSQLGGYSEYHLPLKSLGQINFGFFGSITHRMCLNHKNISDELDKQFRCAFRTLSLTKPDNLTITKIILQSEGFYNIDYLSKLIARFFFDFDELRDKILYNFTEPSTEKDQKKDKRDSQQKLKPSEKTEPQRQDCTHYQFNVRDIRLAIKQAVILRDLEVKAYEEKILRKDTEKCIIQRDLRVQDYTREEKKKMMVREGAKMIIYDTERKAIELSALKEGLRGMVRQRYYTEWVTEIQKKIVEQQDRDNIPVAKREPPNITKIEKELEACIIGSFQDTVSKMRKEKELGKEKKSPSMQKFIKVIKRVINTNRMTKLYKQKSKRRLRHSITTELTHASKREDNEALFTARLEETFQEVIQNLGLDQVTPQLYSCYSMIEYIRRVKAIAIIGPNCSGKTQILKIVSHCLKNGFGIKMRTSAINPVTFTRQELYGSVSAFDQTKMQHESQETNNLNFHSIFQIIIEQFAKEKAKLSEEQKQNLIQSIFIDSSNIDSSLTECFLPFIINSNMREREYIYKEEFLVQLASSGKVHENVLPPVNVTLPNGNVLKFPGDLYFFFEAENLANCSPLFISQIGLVVAQESDLTWKNIFNRHLVQFYKKHQPFFETHKLRGQKIMNSCFTEFLLPFVEILNSDENIKQWNLWNLKSLICQFFNLINSIFYKFAAVAAENINNIDPMAYPLQECAKDILWSIILFCTIWSFGAVLDKQLRKIFEEKFMNYKRYFNQTISGPTKKTFTIFDIFFDLEQLQWQMLTERLEYKLKLAYEPMFNQLLIPTLEISQAYLMMDYIMSSMHNDQSLDKHFRLLGPSGTSKSVILSTFAQRNAQYYTSINIPMSAYLTIDKLKKAVESHYTAVRKNLYEPKEKEKKVLLILDDLHLQSNLEINLLEFLRTWCISKGYFDTKKGYFKKIGDFGTISAQNSEYRSKLAKVDGKQPLSSRFLNYTNSFYCEEFTTDRFKSFIQHWLTSKLWATSRLVNSYYVIITNSLMHLADKISRTSDFNNSSFLKLHKFQFFAKLCQNLVINSVISEAEGQVSDEIRHEDVMADILSYEIMRSIGDRIMNPKERIKFLEHVAEINRHEFLCDKSMDKQHIESLILGNYHDKEEGSHMKYINQTNDIKRVRKSILNKIREKSSNSFLEGLVDAPNGIKEIFRLSRLLYCDNQHAIIIGQPGSCKREYLQIAAIVNNSIIIELQCSNFGSPLHFDKAFRNAILSCLRLDNIPCTLIIDDQLLRDPIYIDFIYNFIHNLMTNEQCVLYDEAFKKKVLSIEEQLFYQNKENFRYDKNKKPNMDQLFKQAMLKMKKYFHIVFLVNDQQTYFEWISMFPSLESKCEVMFMDEFDQEGYQKFASDYLDKAHVDKDAQKDGKLAKSLVMSKQLTLNKYLALFYSKQMAKIYHTEKFLNHQVQEYLVPHNEKIIEFMYSNGWFRIEDPLFHCVNYNIAIPIDSLYKHRFLLYIQVFKFLYEHLQLNLIIRKNFYQTFLKKAKQFTEFFKDIDERKQFLHTESDTTNYKIVVMREKIKQVEQAIVDKELTITRRYQEIEELKLERAERENEVKTNKDQKDYFIDDVLENLEKINGGELAGILNNIDKDLLQEKETMCLDTLALIVEKDINRAEFIKSQHNHLFVSKIELCNLLSDCRNYDYPKDQFLRIKLYISKTQSGDFAHSKIFALLDEYINGLFRKLNIKNTMAKSIARIKEIETNIDSAKFSINYSKQFIVDKKAEQINLNRRLSKITNKENVISKRIQEAEISHMRTGLIFHAVQKHAIKFENRLQKIKDRLNTLTGDCIILAASITLLGPMAINERVVQRNELCNYISKNQNIPCSEDWKIGPEDIKKHNRVFKWIIQDLGFKQTIMDHSFQGILPLYVLCEVLFALIFAPSCPIVVDPTGEMQEYMVNVQLPSLSTRVIRASDERCNELIEQTLRSNTFCIVNDLNQFQKFTSGLSQDACIMQRLSSSLYNGFDFQAKRHMVLQKLNNFQDLITYQNGLNKRIPCQNAQRETLTYYQAQIFTPKLDFEMSSNYHATSTIQVAMSTDRDINLQDESCLNAAWVKIKECMMQCFIPVEFKEYEAVKNKLKQIKVQEQEMQKAFENAFLVSNSDTLKRIGEFSQLRQSVEDIENLRDEKQQYEDLYREKITEMPLLNYYSKIILQIYLSIKRMSKIMNETTQSWKMFLEVVRQIIQKTVIEATRKVKKQSSKGKSVHNSIDSRLSGQDVPEFTIDEEFFSQKVLPNIHKHVMSSIKQTSASIFNLILSFRIKILHQKANENEMDFFFNQMFTLEKFSNWRDTEHDFVDQKAKIDRYRYQNLKREITKLYPDFARKVTAKIEQDLGTDYVYADISLYMNQINQNMQGIKKLNEIERLNFGFYCPDHEFKANMTKFVYSSLSPVFEFDEEFLKFSQYVRNAQWISPIALVSDTTQNVINTVCSVANHFGVGLEILRTDPLSTRLDQEKKNRINVQLHKQIKEQLVDYTVLQQKDPLEKFQRFDQQLHIKLLQKTERINMNAQHQKLNWHNTQQRNQMEDDENITFALQQDPLRVIESAAMKGSWVLISNVKFPLYWQELCDMLQRMDQLRQIHQNFRIMIDLQNFSQNEIPESFLFNHSVSFQMTQVNQEHMEDENDVWNHLLDEYFLNQITGTCSYFDAMDENMRPILTAEQLAERAYYQNQNEEDKEEDEVELDIFENFGKITQSQLKEREERNAQSNIRLVDKAIKKDHQRALYKEFMKLSKVEEEEVINMEKHDSAQSLADLLAKTQQENDMTAEKLQQIKKAYDNSGVELPQEVNSIKNIDINEDGPNMLRSNTQEDDNKTQDNGTVATTQPVIADKNFTHLVSPHTEVQNINDEMMKEMAKGKSQVVLKSQHFEKQGEAIISARQNDVSSPVINQANMIGKTSEGSTVLVVSPNNGSKNVAPFRAIKNKSEAINQANQNDQTSSNNNETIKVMDNNYQESFLGIEANSQNQSKIQVQLDTSVNVSQNSQLKGDKPDSEKQKSNQVKQSEENSLEDVMSQSNQGNGEGNEDAQTEKTE